MMKASRMVLLNCTVALLLNASNLHAEQTDFASVVTFTTQEDHQQMLGQLRIATLRPGRSASPNGANPANYDEAKANPFPDWPAILQLQDGTPVTTAQKWWTKRRPEIVELFEREVYGRVPDQVPAVTWTLRQKREDMSGEVPIEIQHLVGTVENTACRDIEVDRIVWCRRCDSTSTQFRRSGREFDQLGCVPLDGWQFSQIRYGRVILWYAECE
jgi:hypothetical protein